MKLKLGMLFIEKFLTMLWPKKKKNTVRDYNFWVYEIKNRRTG